MAGNDAAGQPLTNHPTFITYSFQNNTSGLSIDGNGQAFANSFRILSDIEKANARAAFAEWDKWSGITFLEVPSGQGDIKLAHFNFDLGGPYTSAQAAAYGGGGIVFVSEKVVGSVQLMLHEIGHNLGLKHPFEGDFTLPKSSDSYETTVMSYTSGGTNGSTLGTLDKDAIAYLYGAPGTDGSQVASWNWDASIYQLTQVGRDIAETITGISSADIIEGRGGDDRINGRGGDDRLYGGAGNDLIDGGDGRDLIDGGDGNDTLSGSSFSGDRTGGDTLYGGAGQDVLFGDRGGFFDLLDGGDGDDTIYANAGDSIYGGAGDDQILLQSITDLGTTIIDGGVGNDRVSISFAGTADRTLTTTSLRLASVETLMLYTGAGNDLITDDSGLAKVDLSGGAGDDVIRAGSGEGSIRGEAGNDVLFAGTGFTFLYGGAGADRFVFASASTSPNARADQIEDFETGIDVIDLSAMGASAIRIEAVGTSNWITATAKDGAFRLFVRQAVSMGDIVTQSGLITGTAGNDVLKGSAANDTIYGYAGNDSLDGGAGNDLIDGGDGQDTLVGGGGIDTLIGGPGNDLYVIGSATTVIRENAGEGTDTAIVTAAAGLTSYTLNADALVEIVSAEAGSAKINITGNGFSQVINGNDGANILSTGGGAPDTLNGGLGDDIYRVFSTGDVIEDSGGFDTVYASGTSYFLYSTASVEYLSTSEQAGTQGFYMVGNGASQVIVGNYGDNTINGRGGDGVTLPDTLIGLFGNDTYGVFSQGDVVREVDGQGIDVVYANASYQLRAGTSIEILSAVDQSATGAANAFTLRGNAFAQTIAGNGADNVIDGRGGNDTLVGLGGADVFAFTTALDGTNNVDTIRDFAVGADRIGLATDIFAAVTDGGIGAGEFVVGTAAADADDRLVYDQATGRLWYDADGNGAGAQILFAQLAAGTALTAASFTPIAPVAELAAG